ncbi:hypothetical protein Glove_59g119 [Diversispora epigaea]|uniref:HAT C-terminal dimerisation domain-containing protein n=1 Tax=Diversispora epigaea TaxID=1348612 RepID=A0A397JC17_9GLOM|nr:hypothetical protein Glove_59g119 [Diversispora epigaea]
MQVTLPILSNIALDYIWLPISSCSVERSFSTYNILLSLDHQNLSQESLKQLSMLYFNVKSIILPSRIILVPKLSACTTEKTKPLSPIILYEHEVSSWIDQK